MSEIQLAVKLVKQVNKLLLNRFKPSGTDTLKMKKDEEIVTQADMDANKLITDFLLKYFPNDDIISEEALRINKPGKKTWYIDPLDGTTNFAYGFREFATCLARVDEKGETEIGVIGLPAFNEVFWAAKNSSAYLNGKKIHVSKKHEHRTREMFLFCGGHSNEGQYKFTKIMQKINPKQIRFRSFASAGIELTAVASGRAEGCALVETHPWDVLAGILIVRSAGGKVSNFKGKNWNIKDMNTAASNGPAHKKLIGLIK